MSAPTSEILFNILLTAFVFGLAVVSVIDIKTMTIPNIFVLALLLLGIANCFANSPVPLLDKLLGIPAAAALPLMMLIATDGMGGGDVKLFAAVGLFLGWKRALPAMFLALFLGAACSAVLIFIFKKSRHTQIPFAPFVTAGFLLALLAG